MIIDLEKYGPILSDREEGESILTSIKKALENNNKIEVNFSSIKSMATFNAKQIFGQLYIELGSDDFFKRILLKNVTPDIRYIIKIGIQSALEDTSLVSETAN